MEIAFLGWVGRALTDAYNRIERGLARLVEANERLIRASQCALGYSLHGGATCSFSRAAMILSDRGLQRDGLASAA